MPSPGCTSDGYRKSLQSVLDSASGSEVAEDPIRTPMTSQSVRGEQCLRPVVLLRRTTRALGSFGCGG
jgi:hypothetical protein